MHTCNAPRLDARLAAAYDFVRPGHAAADIGCDHGKLSAALAGSGRCPLVLACDLRPGPLEKAILRRWLARRGFALRAETLCQAAGRWYAVMNAQYTGAAREPDGLFCLTGLTNGQPGCSEYYAVQNEKLKKYRLGLPEGEENEAVGKLIAELEHLSKP